MMAPPPSHAPMPAVFFEACQHAAVADILRRLDGSALRRGCLLLRLRDDRPTSAAAFFEHSLSPPSDADDGGVIQVFVSTLSQRTLVVRAPATETVAALHGRVELATGVPCAALRLLHGGRLLSPESTLAAAGVQSDDTLYLSARLRSTPRLHAWRLASAASAVAAAAACGGSGGGSADLAAALAALAAAAAADAIASPRYVDFQGLHFSGAAAAVVGLYSSACPAVRREAASIVRKLVRCGRGGVAALIFCHQLAAAAGMRDELYREMRSVVLGLLRRTGPAVAVEALVPLVADAAASALKHIATLFDAPPSPLLDRLSDFLRLLDEALTATRCADRSVEGILGLIKEDSLYRLIQNALRILLDAFVGILSAAGNVLRQQAGSCPGGKRAVDVLAVVNEFAEIFPDFGPVLRVTLSAVKEPLDVLLRQAERGTNLHWLLKCKNLRLSFEAKRNLVLMLLPEVAYSDYDEQHEMLIDRSNLLAESFEYISHASSSVLRHELLTEFIGEGATGPGVTREWFFLVCRKVFSPENVLFLACPADRRRFFPNPASSTDSMNLEYFKFSGRLIALALMHKVQVGITFDRTFFLQLAGKAITLEDVKDADPFLYSSCKWLLEVDPDLLDSDDLGLTFCRDVEVLGSRKNVELCAGGKDIVVNSKNREHYVNLFIQHSFVTSVASQVEQFARGFADVLSDRTHQRLFFESLELEDVDHLLCGRDGAISVMEWQKHTMYECYREKDPQIRWFWKIVAEMSEDQRRVLLFFWTAVKYLPAEGFKGLNSRLCIHRATSRSTALPISQTCFYRLSIPAYNSESTMRDRLHFITQEHVSCSFGMS